MKKRILAFVLLLVAYCVMVTIVTLLGSIVAAAIFVGIIALVERSIEVDVFMFLSIAELNMMLMLPIVFVSLLIGHLVEYLYERVWH